MREEINSCRHESESSRLYAFTLDYLENSKVNLTLLISLN